MANYTNTIYAVEGDKAILEKIATAIQNEDGNLYKVFPILGLNFENTPFEDCRGEWSNAKVEDRNGKHVLFFEQYWPWEEPDVIGWVLEKLGQAENSCVYYLSVMGDETNDYEGKYFNYHFSIYNEDIEDYEFFEKEEDAIDRICEIYNFPKDLKTIENARKYCDEHNEELYINVISGVEN